MQVAITLSEQKQKIIALTLAALPVLLLVTVVASFIDSQIDRYQQTTVLVRKIARERTILEQAPRWQEELQQLRSSPEWQRLFVAPPPGRSGAVESLVRRVGAHVERSATWRMETSGAIEIDERVLLSASIEQLVKILESLRGGQPLFVIRSISVESTETANSSNGTHPNMLRIELVTAEFERPL